MKKNAVIIVGGGLAGLTAAIHLSGSGIPVTLFEKEEFPHHKVCGEYVSREVLPYLRNLGVSLQELTPMEISRLLYSTGRGNPVEVQLPLGGLGISRYAFDSFLYKKAVENGVKMIRQIVTSVNKMGERMEVCTSGNDVFSATAVLGAFGKRSNLDKHLSRSFFKEQAPWLAVKSHYRYPGFPDDLVALHNFRGGYCGLSKTETGAVNVCYLATYQSFKKQKDPKRFQELVLRKNPFLDEFFSRATPIFHQPLTIAQVSFEPKSTVEDHMLMLGDAAGLLYPLCGNGMAMAIHSGKIASELVLKHLNSSSFKREELEKEYSSRWTKEFRSRLRTGKWLQNILLNERLAEISQSVVSKVPFVLPQIIKRTHGRPIT